MAVRHDRQIEMFRRNIRMAEMRDEGMTLEEVGEHYNLTRERVRQILNGQTAQTYMEAMEWFVATSSMCPHCGELFSPCDLIPTHNWPKPTRQVCPGSGQIPRDPISDGRPLWNGKPNPHFFRTKETP